MAEETAAARLAQLAEGTEGAAASLPPEHSGLGASAAEAAARVAAAAEAVRRVLDGGGGTRRAAGGAGGGSAGHRLAAGADPGHARAALGEAVATLEALHFALLRIKVHGAEPAEVGAAGKAEEVARRGAALEALVETPAGVGGSGEETSSA